MKKLGFTLAEVLITLVIIGVIAAMTVPSLMQNTNSQEYRSALKKAISGVNQALTLEYALEGLTAADFDDSQSLVDDVFKERMSVVDTEDATDWNSVEREGECSDNATWTTNDGIKFCLTSFTGSSSDEENTDGGTCDYANTTPCGEDNILWIDVNGDRKPNRATTSYRRPRDIYQAQVYSQKIIAYGDPTQQVMFERNASEDSSSDTE